MFRIFPRIIRFFGLIQFVSEKLIPRKREILCYFTMLVTSQIRSQCVLFETKNENHLSPRNIYVSIVAIGSACIYVLSFKKLRSTDFDIIIAG